MNALEKQQNHELEFQTARQILSAPESPRTRSKRTDTRLEDCALG